MPQRCHQTIRSNAEHLLGLWLGGSLAFSIWVTGRISDLVEFVVAPLPTEAEFFLPGQNIRAVSFVVPPD